MLLKTLTCCVVILLPASRSFGADNAASIIRLGKNATALVETTNGPLRSSGTAFCVNAAGFFVTNRHVVQEAGRSVRLVLNPGESNQRITTAEVLRVDPTEDLALLRAKEVKDVGVLEIGATKDLFETEAVTAFGYPFGQSLSTGVGEFPNVSVSIGHITSLRKKQGKLALIQLDASLNPGNSGGPVLDPEGKVIGIVQAGIPGASLNFAIPATQLNSVLGCPEIEFDPPFVPEASWGKEQTLTVKLIRFANSSAQYDVEITFTPPGGGRSTERHVEAQLDSSGNYLARFTPVAGHKDASLVDLTVKFADGSVSFTTNDIDLADTRGVSFKLSEVLRILPGNDPILVLPNGTQRHTKIRGLGEVEATLGPVKSKIDLRKAESIEVAQRDEVPDALNYVVTVGSAGKKLGELHGALILFHEGAGSQTVHRAPQPMIVASAVNGTGLQAPEESAQPSPRTAPRSLPRAGTSAAQSNREAADAASAESSQDRPTHIRLAAPADAVFSGGSGKFLLILQRSIRQIAVFDTKTRTIVKYLPVAGDDALCCAGAQKLFVLLPEKGVLQRWDLKNFTREMTLPVPQGQPIDGMAMGEASVGPLMLVRQSGPQFIDTKTLRPVAVNFDGNTGWQNNPDSGPFVRASADGNTFASWEGQSSPSGIRLLTLRGTRATTRYLHESGGVLLPSVDGSLLFTSFGVYTADLQPLNADVFKEVMCLPLLQPEFFLGLRVVGNPLPGLVQAAPTAAIYTCSDRRLLVDLPKMDELTSIDRWGNFARGLLPVDQRIHFFPSSKLLVTVPNTRTELVLRTFDLTAEMDRLAIDYLFISSSPPRAVTAGTSFNYPIVVESKRGGVQFTLEGGPEGMIISAAGVIQWKVPAGAPADLPMVIVNIKDSSGQEIYHNFNITIESH